MKNKAYAVGLAVFLILGLYHALSTLYSVSASGSGSHRSGWSNYYGSGSGSSSSAIGSGSSGSGSSGAGSVPPAPTAAPGSSKTKSKSSGDPYDAASYLHPDDFYYDHLDDFWDYEDAEDYWQKHQEK